MGALAQLGEHLLCKQRVVGSIPTGSTKIIAPQARILDATLSCSAVRGRADKEPSVLIDEGSTFLVLAGIRPAVSMAPATASLTS